MIARIRKSFFTKLMSVVLIIQMTLPTDLLAITGGPSQPEFISFTPVGVSDMVNVFTGDFQYNIPLLDVEGYPVNLSYAAGVGMEDQASIVGLGWTLNAGGMITRNVRGIPDDFNGEDKIETTTNIRPDWTVGANVSLGGEIVGSEIGAGLSLFYNNYKGLGFEQSANVSLSIQSGNRFKMGGSASLGLTANTETGIGIKPEIGLNANIQKNEKSDNGMFSGSLSASVGTPYTSRGGLRQVTIGGSAMASVKGYGLKTDHKSVAIPIGLTTYVPQITNSMLSYSVGIDFGTGLEAEWIFTKLKWGGNFSVQKLADKEKASPAYGYLYADRGKNNDAAMHDFNREKDGAFTERTPSVGMTQMTYDIYTASGQGVSGMFRPFRDFGTVYDPYVYSASGDGSLGGDIGAAAIIKGGLNVTMNANFSSSGRWSDGNDTRKMLSFNGEDETTLTYEPVYFKSSGEFTTINEDYFDKIQGWDPVRIKIDKDGYAYKKYIRDNSPRETDIISNKRVSREKRNQSFSFLTAEQAQYGSLEKKISYYRLNQSIFDSSGKRVIESMSNRIGNGRKNHHISEVTVTNPDGIRYVYGMQTYNHYQEEVTFNKEKDSCSLNTGFVKYNDDDNSPKNDNGIDHYYNKNVLPPYATAYLLTALLTPDYSDLTGDGPTPDDLGNYTKFNYSKLCDNYGWRNPYNKNTANFQEGLKCKNDDDKGTYLYGEKEIVLLHSIETKNYVAEFHYSERYDAYDVNDNNGGIGSQTLQKLDSISLYSIHDRRMNGENAVPLKTVHFNYDYSLCKGIPSYKNPNSQGEGRNYPTTESGLGGKLTLKEVYFTYGKSKKGKFSPYKFNYNETRSEENPDYNPRAMDRWGGYKPNNSPLSNLDFPYVQQNEENVDTYAAVWSLKEITLPSGGVIKVEYESDDYAFVQDKRATNMVKILGFGKNSSSSPSNKLYSKNLSDSNFYVFFEAPDSLVNDKEDFKVKYFGEGEEQIKELFFRCFVYLSKDNKDGEYVSGYIDIANQLKDPANYGWDNGVGWIKLPEVSVKDDEEDTEPSMNPIAKAAMQYVRINAPELFYGGKNEDDGEILKLFRKMVGLFDDVLKMVRGANKAMADKGMCETVDTTRSCLRLMTVTENYAKRGGGLRVKQLTINDQWRSMSGNNTEDFAYGQRYEYTKIADGTDAGIPQGAKISSGVATYEPFIGNEENPMRQPVTYKEKNALAPDNRYYQEKPYGEMFFPSPSVGYSQVKVTNLSRPGVTRTATGCTVHEFYTAKDFPVIVHNPVLDKLPNKPSWLSKIFNVNVKDYMTVNQSYSIELNDMHGKPKAQRIYAEGQDVPISEVEYYYKQQSSKQLSNEITAISKNNIVQYNRLAGIDVEMVTDEREQKSSTIGGFVNGNLDISPVPFIIPFPLPIPSVWAGVHNEETCFRSITNTKVITRYGILEKTVAKDLGSRVETENLAWDDETGEVLLTRTQNEFGDNLYSFTYPAHWGYDGMAGAYKNVGVKGVFDLDNIGDGANRFFSVGDELCIFPGQGESGSTRAWVMAVGGNSVNVVDENGNPITGTHNILVTRSGRRNQQTTSIGTVTSLDNPIVGEHLDFTNARIINSGAVEFSDAWENSFCVECDVLKGLNPYLRGISGNYRPKRSWVYLTGRTQSNENRNTDIRHDGYFTTYSPFWNRETGRSGTNNNDWKINAQDWTFASEVTMFSPYGFELENKDALGRYSSATYGYSNTLPTAVSGNARYREIGADNFEDKDMQNCDGRFEFSNAIIDNTRAHTGKHSLKVQSGTDVLMDKDLIDCDEVKEMTYPTNIVVPENKEEEEPKTISVNNYKDDSNSAVMPKRNDNSNDYRYGFGGHEKDDEVSGRGNHLSFGDYGYDPRLGRRWNTDPEDQIGISNYAAFRNNPMIYIDPNGREVVIDGKEKDIAFTEVQKSVASELKLSMDDNGVLSYEILDKTVQLSSDAQQLVEAIDAPQIRVNVNANNTQNMEVGDDWFIGGASNGAYIVGIGEEVYFVNSNQDINPIVLSKMDEALGAQGKSTLHEITEGYQIGIISLTEKRPIPRATSEEEKDPNSAYRRAHSRATPQISEVLSRLNENRTEIEFYVLDKEGKAHIIATRKNR